MYGKTVCRFACVSAVLLMASAGLAQTSRPLPDAPSAVLMRERLAQPNQSPKVSSQILREERVRVFLPTAQGVRSFQPESLSLSNDTERLTAIGHKLVPALPMQTHLRYEPSDSPDVFGRATHAISRVLLAHDKEGRVHANSAYLFGAMVTSVLSTAYQPYDRHDPTEVLGNFGSTVGGAVGINMVREFWPQLKQRLSSRVPRVLQRRGAQISNP